MVVALVFFGPLFSDAGRICLRECVAIRPSRAAAKSGRGGCQSFPSVVYSLLRVHASPCMHALTGLYDRAMYRTNAARLARH